MYNMYYSVTIVYSSQFFMKYSLVEGFSVTVRCTGICKFPFTHKYQPLLAIVKLIIVTVETLWAFAWMITCVLSIDPDDPVTQDLPCSLSLHHSIFSELLSWKYMVILSPLNPVLS